MKLLAICIILIMLVSISGCIESFAAGVSTGVVAAEKISNDAQERFVESVNALNEETKKINTKIEAVEDIDVKSFVKPETKETIVTLKNRAKDPVSWAALLSLLANGVWAGRTLEKRIKK